MWILQEGMQDETVWDNPEEFKPERFLDENGKLSLKKDPSMPFGAGKRLCAGETFARNMWFLFMGALLQNFTATIPEGHRMPGVDETQTGLIRFPPEFWVKLVPRT